MKNAIALAAVLLSLSSGCAARNVGASTVQTEKTQQDVIILSLAELGGQTLNYVIDRRTRMCFLQNTFFFSQGVGVGLVEVPCERIKRTTPEAATYISWDEAELDQDGDEAASPVTPE